MIEGIEKEYIEVVDFGVERLMSRQAWGIQPKNIGQAMALHTLLDPHIDLVIRNDLLCATLQAFKRVKIQ